MLSSYISMATNHYHEDEYPPTHLDEYISKHSIAAPWADNQAPPPDLLTPTAPADTEEAEFLPVEPPVNCLVEGSKPAPPLQRPKRKPRARAPEPAPAPAQRRAQRKSGAKSGHVGWVKRIVRQGEVATTMWVPSKCPGCGCPPLSQRQLDYQAEHVKPGRIPIKKKDRKDARNMRRNKGTKKFYKQHLDVMRMTTRDMMVFHGITACTVSRNRTNPHRGKTKSCCKVILRETQA